jgi:hypothetical protein
MWPTFHKPALYENFFKKSSIPIYAKNFKRELLLKGCLRIKAS